MPRAQTRGRREVNADWLNSRPNPSEGSDSIFHDLPPPSTTMAQNFDDPRGNDREGGWGSGGDDLAAGVNNFNAREQMLYRNQMQFSRQQQQGQNPPYGAPTREPVRRPQARGQVRRRWWGGRPPS